MSRANKVVMPGGRIGIFGGGQLGRMTAQAAQRLGYHVSVYSPETNGPAHQVVSDSFQAEYEDLDSIRRFAQSVDVITLEFENIPAVCVEEASRWTLVRPGSQLLSTAQHRLIEKTTLRDWGLPVTPFAAVDSTVGIESLESTLGYPAVMKTATSGYDGKGQSKVASTEQAKEFLGKFPNCEIIAEKLIDLSCEVSAIVARSPMGEIRVFPLFLNMHANHILDVTLCPIPEQLLPLERKATEIAKELAAKIQLEGLLCIEFFIDRSGNLMINELAPRPHNSGHLTIEGFKTSQFEQQVRAVCNLPLGDTGLHCPAIAMANLLGDLWFNAEGVFSVPRFEQVFADPRASLHLYGKSDPKPGRKMGHLTVAGSSATEAEAGARQLRDSITR